MKEEEEISLKLNDYAYNSPLKEYIEKDKEEFEELINKGISKEYFIETQMTNLNLLKAFVFFTLATEEIYNQKKTKKALEILDKKSKEDQYSTLDLLKQKFQLEKIDPEYRNQNFKTVAKTLDSRRNWLTSNLGLLKEVIEKKINVDDLLKKLKQNNKLVVIFEGIKDYQPAKIANDTECIMKMLQGCKGKGNLIALCVYDFSHERPKKKESLQLEKKETFQLEKEEEPFPFEEEEQEPIVDENREDSKKEPERRSIIEEEEQPPQEIDQDQKSKTEVQKNKNEMGQEASPKNTDQQSIKLDIGKKDTFKTSDYVFYAIFVIIIILAVFADDVPTNFKVSQLSNGQYPLLKIASAIDQKLTELSQ